jgi:hypothetical protein
VWAEEVESDDVMKEIVSRRFETFSLLNISGATKSRLIIPTICTAGFRETEINTKCYLENQNRRDRFLDLGLFLRIVRVRGPLTIPTELSQHLLAEWPYQRSFLNKK